MVKFAISREPTDRAISASYWLQYVSKLALNCRRFYSILKSGAVQSPIHCEFDRFLTQVENIFAEAPKFNYSDLHFATHIAKLHDDVIDDRGAILLKDIARISDLAPALSHIIDKVRGD